MKRTRLYGEMGLRSLKALAVWLIILFTAAEDLGKRGCVTRSGHHCAPVNRSERFRVFLGCKQIEEPRPID